MLSKSVLYLGKAEFGKVHFWPSLKSHLLIILCSLQKGYRSLLQ